MPGVVTCRSEIEQAQGQLAGLEAQREREAQLSAQLQEARRELDELRETMGRWSSEDEVRTASDMLYSYHDMAVQLLAGRAATSGLWALGMHLGRPAFKGRLFPERIHKKGNMGYTRIAARFLWC